MSCRIFLSGSHLATSCLSALAAVIVLGCMPELPRAARVSAEEEPTASDRHLTLSPPAPLDAAPQVFRASLRLPAGSAVDLERMGIFEGELGAGHLRQIVRGELSKALTRRRVPALTWIEQSQADDVVVVLAPTVPLVPGEVYSLASGVPEMLETLHIEQVNPPLFSRLWPPIGLSATASFGIWCGPNPLPLFESTVELEPEGPTGTLRRGAVDNIGLACVRFDPDLGAMELGPFLGPPAITLEDGRIGGLDPRPFLVEASPVEERETPCTDSEIRFGPGCATVADDRILVYSPETPLLWAVGGEGVDFVVAAGPKEPLLISELLPSKAIHLRVITVDVAGRHLESSFSTTMLAPMAHVVINEVLANPLGAEPAQEWVELYNDSLVDAELNGYVIEDVGGQTPLPAATLAPGAFALIVNETYQEDDDLDPQPASGTLILQVPKLGKNGLANGGEPIRLREATGRVASRAPALKASKAGMSLCRTSPHVPDGLAGTFVACWPSPGTENTWNEKND